MGNIESSDFRYDPPPANGLSWTQRVVHLLRRRLSDLPAAAVVAGVLFGAQVIAQTKQPTMDVGTVTLSLGVPRDKVLALITQAGYKFLELAPVGKETRVAVTQRDIDKDDVQRIIVQVDNDGELSFRDGALVRILSKVSASNIETDRDLAFSLYAIAQGLEKEGGNRSCSVRTAEEPSLDPEISAKVLAFICSVGNGVYRTSQVRWVIAEKVSPPFHVGVFQELWR